MPPRPAAARSDLKPMCSAAAPPGSDRLLDYGKHACYFNRRAATSGLATLELAGQRKLAGDEGVWFFIGAVVILGAYLFKPH